MALGFELRRFRVEGSEARKGAYAGLGSKVVGSWPTCVFHRIGHSKGDFVYIREIAAPSAEELPASSSKGSGFRVQDFGFRVWGLGRRVQD